LCVKYTTPMDLPVTPDDALAQPTRARLYSLLTSLRAPAGTDELASELGLHPNGVRVHLERLEDAGLVTRSRVRGGGRGRPRDAWSVAASAQPGGAAPSAYGDLGRWLARTVPARGKTLRAVEESGRELGRELIAGVGGDAAGAAGGASPAGDASAAADAGATGGASSAGDAGAAGGASAAGGAGATGGASSAADASAAGGASPVAEAASEDDRLLAAFAALGFAPERDADGLTYRLGNCPYREAARENRDLVCTLHRGITRGLLDVCCPGAELAAFEPRDPGQAGCVVALAP